MTGRPQALMERQYYVYMMMNQRGTVLYTGITNDLVRRVAQHRAKLMAGFTRKYNVDKLVYFEEFDDVIEAIAREKKIKGWARVKRKRH